MTPETPARGFGGWARDGAAWLTKGAISVPEAVVGLADIPTGGRVGKFLENEDGAIGFRPKQAKEMVNDWHSDAYKANQAKFSAADGIVDKAKVAIENPSLILGGVVESLPSMAAGGVAARGALAAAKAGYLGRAAAAGAETVKGAAIAGGVGEGAVMAGSQASAIRQETDDGELTAGQAGMAAGTGVIGGLLGYGGAKLAQHLGIGNVETMLAQGTKGLAKEHADTATTAATNQLTGELAKSIPRQVIEGALVEGVFEELPQSVTETVMQNLALDKPWTDGLDEAVVMGILTGGAMGAGAAGYHGYTAPTAKQQDPSQAGTAPAAPQGAPAAEQGPALALPAPTITVGADGQAMTATDRNARMQRIASGDVVDVTPVRETLRPSEAMGLRADAGGLEGAAALAVDSGASTAVQPQQYIDPADLPDAGSDAPYEPAPTQAAAQPAIQSFDYQSASPEDRARYDALIDAEAEEWENMRANAPMEAFASLDALDESDLQSFDQASNVTNEEFLRSMGASDEEINDAIATSNQPRGAQGSAAGATQTQANDAGSTGARAGQGQSTGQVTQPAQGIGARIAQLDAQAESADAEARDWASRTYKANGKDLPKYAAQGGPADVGEANEQRRLKAIADAKGRAVAARAEAQALRDQGNADAAVAAKAKKAIQTPVLQAQAATNQGAQGNGAQTPQAQQASTQQPAAGAAAGQAVNRVPAATAAQAAGTAAKQGAVNGGTTTGNNGAQASEQGQPQSQAQVQAIAQEGNARRAAEQQRKIEGSERWTRMTTAERQAAAANAKGLNPIAKKNVHTKPWADLSEKVRAALLDVVHVGDKPAKDSGTQDSAYSLPSGSIGDEWRDGQKRSPEHPEFTPTPRQQRLMDVVKKVLDGGAFYNDDVQAKVAEALGISDEIKASNRSNVKGGDFGYDVYYARKAVEAKAQESDASKIRAEMKLQPGDKLGTLIFNDFKQTNSVEVVSITEDGRRANFKGKRGAATVTFEATIPTVKFAIERAHEKGKRKDSYEEFIAGRANRTQTVRENETPQAPEAIKTDAVAQAAAEAATHPDNDTPAPTEAQKEAGNYKKGHVRLHGLEIAIENAAGTQRNPAWPALKNHYGYFKGSVGADKDHVDVFLTDKAEDASLPVFVVDQKHRNGKFDEHKVIMGAANEAEARTTYLQNYEKGWTGLDAITEMTLDDFKAWVMDAEKTKNPASIVLRKTHQGDQQATKDKEPQEVIHKGTRLYQHKARLQTKEGQVTKQMWGVESPENKGRRLAGERTISGDTLVDTLEQAKAAAEREAQDFAERKAYQEQQDAEDRAQREKREAQKEANRGKSIEQRRKDSVLDAAHKYPASAGVGTGSRREAMQKAVEQERAIVEREVGDNAAKKRDKDTIEKVRIAGYILGLSNENIPLVKAGLEAQARLKENNYKKPEYRLYSDRKEDGPFFEITKTEYEYAQSLIAQRNQAQEANSATDAAPAQERTEYPFGKLDADETDAFIGQRVRVLPEMEGDTAWEGEVGMVLKHGRLLEVKREGRDLRIRVPGDRIEVLNAASVPRTPAEQFEQRREKNKSTDGDQAPFRAFGAVAGTTGESYTTVWSRWNSVMEFVDAIRTGSGADVARRMQEQLVKEPWRNDAVYPGEGRGMAADAGVQAWRNRLSKVEQQYESFSRDLDREELRARDAENFGASAEAVDAARKAVAQMRKRASQMLEETKEGLKQAEARDKAEKAAEEKVFQDSFEAPSQSVMAKKPTPASITSWSNPTELRGQKLYTNGHIVDATGTEPHLKGWETRLGVRKDISPDQMDRVLGLAGVRNGMPDSSYVKAEPFALIDDKKNGRLFFDVDGQLVGVDLTYAQYFISKVKGATFMVNPNDLDAAVRVMDGDKLAGILMPIRQSIYNQDKLTVEAIRGYMAASGKDKPQSIAKRLQKAAEVPAQAEDEKLTPAQAKELMVWQDMGQKDGVKTHTIYFYESQADKDAKRGRMAMATVTLGDRSATNWMVEGDDQAFSALAMAKKRAEEIALAKAVADGYVESAPTAQADESQSDVEGFPIAQAVQSYSGISHNGTARANGDKEAFDKFMATATAAGEGLAETDAQREALSEAVKQLRGDYLTQYRTLMNVRAGTYSGYVAGRGNLNSKQANSRNNALDKAMQQFDGWVGDNVDRIKKAVLGARTPEQVQADRDKLKAETEAKLAKKNSDLKAQLLKFLSFKSGEDMPYGKSAIITRVSYDKDGYPSSLKFKMADGSPVTDDKIELTDVLKDKGETIAQAKARIRALVDEVRAENPELTKGVGAIRASASSKAAQNKEKVERVSADYLNGAVKGDTITASSDFDYVTGGKPMVIEDISPKGEVHVVDPVRGGRTSFKADMAAARRITFEVKKAEPEKAPESYLDRHNAVEDGISAGTLELPDYKAAFADLEANKAQVIAELQKLTKDQLLKAGGPAFAYRMRDDKKDAIVQAAYSKMLDTYAMGRSYGPSSYFLSADGIAKNKAEKAQALRDMVANTTAEDLAARAAEIKEARDEFKAKREAAAQAMANPKTLQDFRTFMRHWVDNGETTETAYLRLTPEQRQRYDELEAEQTKEQREAAKRRAKVAVASAGNTTAGEVIATKHTKHGHDLFVVKLADRVERDAYETLNNSAKRLGGSYSSYRGNGAIPGFQFRTREAAEAFRQLVAGDTQQAEDLANQRRDAFEDDKSQSAAERLRTMAEALDDRANEALGADRKQNTARRARFAAAAEAAARGQQALAGTMRNIAKAIDDGSTKFLDGVRQRVQVEYLMAQLRAAKSNQLEAKYPNYGDRQSRQGEPLDAETVDFAKFPRFEMFRSDLATLARKLLEIDGGKKLGGTLQKLADDVSDAYVAWAKDNLLRVSHFSNKDTGDFAEFASRDDAERAIKRSGLVGKAVVLSVKRGQNRVILSPGEAMQQGLWQGDGDKRIRLSMEFVEDLAKLGKRKGSKVLALPWQLEAALDNRQRLQRMGIQTPAEFRSALRELASLQQEIATPNRIKELERSMVGRKADGLDFFPTSPAVVSQMLEAAEIQDGMAVLEPSAGMGHIADAIVAETGVWPDVIELSGDRRELLEAKGFHLAEVNDFMLLEPRKFFTYGDTFRAPDGVEGIMRGLGGMGSQRVRLEDKDGNRLGLYDRGELVGIAQNGTWSGYDRIVMNPPFSDGRDIQHVQHAYNLLKPGGRMVAIMGEGAFFHSNKRAEAFREWLDTLGATNEKLPDGSFLDPSLPVNTGVAARMVVIDKPMADVVFSRSVADVQAQDRAKAVKITQGVVDSMRAAWSNGPEVVVAYDMQDPVIPEAVRRADKQQRSGGAAGNPEGFYYKGKAYVLASQMRTANDVSRVVAHEVLGHYGLRGMFGQDLGRILDQIAVMRKEQVRAKAIEYGLRGVDKLSRRVAAEEVLAEMAQATPRLHFVQRAIAAIRTWLRKHVPGLQSIKMTDAEIINNYILPARAWVERGGPDGNGPRGGERIEPVMSRSKAASGTDVTQTEAFKRWFGDSKVMDAEGKPLAVYHGTSREFSAFDTSRSENPGEVGAFFTDAEDVAGMYGSNVVAAYLSITNPYVVTNEQWSNGEGLAPKDAKSQGYDGYIVRGMDGADTFIAFTPTQIKSATGNNGNFDPDSDNILFSRSKMAELKDKGLQMAHTYMSHPGKVSLWDKTVGTMRHVAERYPAFKPVFEAAQQFIDDVSSIANEAAQYAPRLIPRVETVRDMLKKPISVVDNKAIGKALFGGNLDWGRDQHGKAMPIDELKAKYAGLTVDQKAEVLLAAKKVDPQMMAAMRGKQLEQFESFINNRFDSTILKAGVAFNHKELRDFFGMNEQQISLYDEARATVDKSLDITARAEMLRALGRDWDGFRDMVMDAPTLTDAWKLLDDELEQRAKAIPDSRDQMAAKMFQIRASHDKARELMDSGYMPLQRFGKYTVWARDKDGETIYYSMHESQAESNRMAETMRREYPDATVTQGTVNEDKYKLFAGITPETAELFGSMLGLDAAGNDAKDQAFQEFLKLSKNNHSALKRLIHRKGIAGYSEDVGRVLASFVYSNARLAATGLNAGKMEAAINDLNTTHKEQGELGKIAAKLRSYIQDPQEEGQVIRGMLFAQYLGGSIASAMVNMTQPFAVTLPWLSQFGGMAKASKYMSAALKDMAQSALKKGFSYEPDLAHALKMAEDDGTVSPQEIHQLMAQSRGAGGLRTGDGTKTGDARAAASNAWEKGKVAWGQPFALAEQFNRRSTFIAAYRIARDRGMDNPAQFARRAVVETQFLYTKANKPQWARGAIGGTLFTFKTYSVSFLELMHRTWNAGEPGSPERAAGRRAVGWAMLMLMLMSGAGGLPFVEDVEDLVDGAGQMMGYNFSLKQERKQFMAKMLGAELADFLETGLSGLPGMPLDVSGRLGMDNLIPGTGLALNKQSSTRDIVEMLGPAGDLVSRAFSGAGDMLAGLFTADAARMGRGAMEVMPTAVRNLQKGADMATSGMYKDSKGYKVMDTRFDEAVWKMIGFQPRAVAVAQESTGFVKRGQSFYTQTSNEIRAQWAKALFERDEAAVKRVRERLAKWNENNPDMKITIKMNDIWERARNMNKDRAERMADTAPKALRKSMQDWAREQGR